MPPLTILSIDVMITTIKKEILEKTFPTFDDARCRLQEWAGSCGFSVKVTHTIHSHSILLKPLPNYALSLIVVVIVIQIRSSGTRMCSTRMCCTQDAF
jgi:hypothetical protein